MDYEIRELLEDVHKAIRNRKNATNETLDELRELDEAVCLATRALYMRFKSNTLWCLSVDKNICNALAETLQDAVECLPPFDYTVRPNTDYDIRLSVKGRLDDFEEIKTRLVDDSRDGWLILKKPEIHKTA
jgi:hypothetical protein